MIKYWPTDLRVNQRISAGDIQQLYASFATSTVTSTELDTITYFNTIMNQMVV